MSILDGFLGGLAGAEAINVVTGLIDKHGGLQGLATQFEQHGLGDTMKSWIGTGANQAISPEEVHKVLGSDTVKKYADMLGISSDEMANKIATLLPQTVNTMTPEGQVAA